MKKVISITSPLSQNKANQLNTLKSASLPVPDVDGVYFVFASRKNSTELNEHLDFDLNSQKLKLIYFGIASGITKSGKTGIQKLRGRINNVVGSSSVKRAKYWDDFMISKGIEEFKWIDLPVYNIRNTLERTICCSVAEDSR